MKLIVDPTNYFSLIPLIAKEVTGIDVEVELKIDDHKQRFQRLPLLNLDSDDIVIYSENAICRYFFMKTGKHDVNSTVDYWLEWSSSQLQPHLQNLVLHAWTSKHSDKALIAQSSSCLKHLNSNLQNKNYLISNAITAADVVVWVLLYPLASRTDLREMYLKEYGSVVNFFNSIQNLDPIPKVVGVICKNKGPEHFEKSFSSIKSSIKLPGVSSSRSGSEMNGESVENEEEIVLSKEEIQEAFQVWQTKLSEIPKLKKASHPVLPVPKEKNTLITSALPYVNNVPHLGNIIGSVLSADVYARFSRLRGCNTLFVCGTDEYGTATETKALEEGVTPQEICDKYHKLHSEIYKWFSISFDHFGRTTTKWQTRIAQEMFWKIYKNGNTIEDSVEQLLCEKCDRFLADRFVEGICPFCGYDDARGDQCDKCGKLINAPELKSPRCKVCSTTPVKKISKHLFLDLPKLVPSLVPWFEKSSTGNWSNTAKVITRAWIKDGLKPRCITRDLKWGTPVPLDGFTDKVFYVWFDAPIGYLSITANYTDKWEMWWKNPDNVQLYQFMAKDNVPFHGVVFPSSQIGTADDYTKVGHLIATEYLNYEDTKFSKSRGIGVFGDNAKDTNIPCDIWRFYLLFIRPESQDSTFSWTDLMTKNNSELLNNLGNFINRTITFLANNFAGIIQPMKIREDDKLFIARVRYELKCYIEMLEKIRIRDAIRHILNISRLGNQYIQSNRPWESVKGSAEDKSNAGSLMSICINTACLLSVMVQPYMPNVSQNIQNQLNAPDICNRLSSEFFCYLPEGHKLGKPALLFQKLEASTIAEFQKKFAGRQESPEKKIANENQKPNVSLETVSPASADELNVEITKQGNLVRELKSSRAEKSLIDAAVAQLLELKTKLALATGQNPAALVGKGKKKK